MKKHIRHVWRRFRPHHVSAKTPMARTDEVARLHQSLLEQTPDAVKAQRSMDAHPGAYHTDKGRLYELIDFNDTFVELALALPLAEHPGFIERLHSEMAQYCEEVGSPMFSDEQYDAITRGLTREVAVYLGAWQQGYEAAMTSRREDAMGVDMVITDPRSKRSLNIDCKTPSAYHYRLKDLVQQGRISHDEALQAEEQGYTHQVNGRDDEAVEVTLFRIDPNELGDIKDLTFEEPWRLGKRLQTIFQHA